MNASRPRRLLLLEGFIVAASLAAQPASAVVECTVAGAAGEFAVRRVVVDPPQRGSNLSVSVDLPVVRVIDESNWYMFGGAWLLDPRTGQAHSYRFIQYMSYMGPPVVRATIDDEQRGGAPVPASDVFRRGPQGYIHVNHVMLPGEYYLVGFGVGYGSWSATLRMGGEDVACDPMEIQGRILAFDASHFEGGTHLMAPGVGHGEGLRLSYTNPYSYSVGGLYAHQPPPLPPARVHLATEFGAGWYEQQIVPIRSRARSWDWTANYTGYPSDAPLIRVLQLDLPIGS